MGIARRSMIELTGELRSVDSPSPLHLSPSFHMHEHRTASLLLPSVSIHHAVVGDATPATTRAAAPPCMAAAGLPSSTGHHTCSFGFAGDGGRHGGLGLAGDLAEPH
jgi:hypothetical protein